MGAPKLTRVAPWAAAAVLAGAMVIALARQPAGLTISRHCEDFAACESACDGHAAWACAALARRYLDGEGTAKDPKRAVALFAEACEGGDGHACGQLAWIYENGAFGETEDAAKAEAYQRRERAAHQQGCERGTDSACLALAQHLASGPPQERGTAEAIAGRLRAFWESRCDAGVAAACSRLALLYDDGTFVDEDPQRALALFDRACRLGRAVSCSLGGYRAKALKDDASAAALFTLGCEAEDPIACDEAASDAPSEEARIALLERRRALLGSLCDRDHVEACWQAANAHVDDTRVLPKDREVARGFKEKEIALRQTGCDNGAADDCASLAHTFREGALVARDIVRAQKLYDRACELGDAASCGSRRETLDDVVDASVGYHTCVVKADGTVWCWGQNREGQLGDGTKEDRDAPVQAKGVPKAVSVDIYGATTCIQTEEKQAWCWGGGFDGAERVDGGQAVAAIATGYELACALRENGDVGCSGHEPKSFELGASAVRVSGLMRCAIAKEKLLCWGSVMNDYQAEPTPVLSRDDVVDASVSGEGFCAVFDGGDALCRAQPLAAEPLREVKLTGVRLIGGDADAGCAMRGDELWCWYLRDGALHEPFLVKKLEGVQKLIIRSYEGCALSDDHQLRCWYVFNPDPELVTFQKAAP